MAERWWEGKGDERYWLEATDREDIGSDLRAPLVDASGRENWRYTLFREAQPGDVVFHYDGRHTNGIVGWSRIAGAPEPSPIVWKARGSYARERGAVAEEQPGYRVPLEGYVPLPEPVTLAHLRAERGRLHELVERLKVSEKGPLYFPFEVSQARDVRPMQGYAFKLPAAFVAAFPQLRVASPNIIAEGLLAAEPGLRNPRWTRDELILALDLYLTPFEPPLRQDSAEVAELSKLLSRMARVLGVKANADYRNNNGVYTKLMNYRRFDPAYASTGKMGLSRGNKDEAAVWTEFAADRARLTATATSIRAAVTVYDVDALASVHDEGMEEAQEGRVLTRMHRVRERNRDLVETRKGRALKTTGRLQCEACGFDFRERYGERGCGFIEAHHTRPVHTLMPGEKTRLADLALVCANCHRMIHARRPWISVEELRGLLQAQPTTASV